MVYYSWYMTSEEQLAWMAGIVDGEGSIYISKGERKNRPSLSIKSCATVANCNLLILQPFKDRYGGVIYTYTEKRERHSDHSMWHCATGIVEKFLNDILPYLVGKREQAMLALSYINHQKETIRYKGSFEGKTRGGSSPLSDDEKTFRIGIYNQMRALNAKGRFKYTAIPKS
jgi:hypothetical protein